MPPERSPLSDVDSNRAAEVPEEPKKRTRGPELSEYQRGMIAGMRMAGATPTQIQEETGHSRSAVRHTIDKMAVRKEGKTLPRSGVPEKYDSRERRKMIMNIRKHPEMTHEQRREATGLTMSDSFIRRLALSNGLDYGNLKSPANKKASKPQAK